MKLRLPVLYVAGLGTTLWLSSFAVAIDVWARGYGDGFELIPAFYATIFWLTVVLPLTVDRTARHRAAQPEPRSVRCWA